MKTYDLKQAQEMLQREYVDLMIEDLKFWPAMQFVNFYFVPLNFQVSVSTIVAVVCNTYFPSNFFYSVDNLPKPKSQWWKPKSQ